MNVECLNIDNKDYEVCYNLRIRFSYIFHLIQSEYISLLYRCIPTYGLNVTCIDLEHFFPFFHLNVKSRKFSLRNAISIESVKECVLIQ